MAFPKSGTYILNVAEVYGNTGNGTNPTYRMSNLTYVNNIEVTFGETTITFGAPLNFSFPFVPSYDLETPYSATGDNAIVLKDGKSTDWYYYISTAMITDDQTIQFKKRLISSNENWITPVGVAYGENTTSNGKINIFAPQEVIVCFLSGVEISTPKGMVCVEDLSVGDVINTYGENEQIEEDVVIWCGKSKAYVNPTTYDDKAGYPVRIFKNAIAEGIPYKDLLITSEHCLYFKGKLIPARMLVNDSSIIYDKTIISYDYYHIETKKHSVILADGMLTESYLDTGNRFQFKQPGKVAVLSPLSKEKQWDKNACATLTVHRNEVEPIYRKLQQRAMNINLTSVADEKVLTNDPNLHLITLNRSVIKPVTINDNIYSFLLPKEVNEVYISSRASRPSDVIGPFIDDRRVLGVLIGSIYLLNSNQISSITNHIEQKYLEGWDVLEQTPCRWTNGKALLKLEQNCHKERVLVIKILAAGPYILDKENDEIEIKKLA